MEKLINRFSNKITTELKLDNDNREIIIYGLLALMNMGLSIILVFIFGLIFHVTIEALIICFSGSILRKYSGGAHASSSGRCAAIGTFICIGLAKMFYFLIGPITTFSLLVFSGIGIFTLSYYFIYKLAPVDSIAKPIKTKEKKIRMKKGSIFILNVYLIIVLINIIMYSYFGDRRFLVYSLCIYGGIAWQIFTLTQLGHNAMNKIDFFLSQILTIRKGVN